jgi:fused signal recognition particle receptor
VTKLDTSFKGGVLFRICSELGLPVSFVSIGEDENSLIPLEPEEFVERVVA